MESPFILFVISFQSVLLHKVLVISKYAGVANSISDNLIMNPWHIDEFSTAIGRVLEMGKEERERRHKKLDDFVNEPTR